MSERKKVFLSYSWDHAEHVERVTKLAQDLRTNGINCEIDRFDRVKEEGLERWMIHKIDWADMVFCVCTADYAERFAGNIGGGANFEGMLILAQMRKEDGKNHKFYTLGFSTYNDNPYIPDVLRPWPYFNVSTEDQLRELVYFITEQPEVEPGPIGEVPLRPRANPS